MCPKGYELIFLDVAMMLITIENSIMPSRPPTDRWNAFGLGRSRQAVRPNISVRSNKSAVERRGRTSVQINMFGYIGLLDGFLSCHTINH